MRTALLLLATALTALPIACDKRESPPTTEPQGAAKRTDTTVLSQGAAALQSFDPLKPIDVYLDGFHSMKDHPELVTEAHHYCSARNEDLMQCVIYDANTKDANLVGIEYIISESLFDSLPPTEKRYWHPHNYEILSGQLAAPGLPGAAEKAFLKKKVNSYGKTWHLWDTGHWHHPSGSKLPMGDPMLAWSFNADGQAPADVVADRDQRLGVSTQDKRADRADLAPLAHPQSGVDTLKSFFPGSTGAPNGVANKKD